MSHRLLISLIAMDLDVDVWSDDPPNRKCRRTYPTWIKILLELLAMLEILLLEILFMLNFMNMTGLPS